MLIAVKDLIDRIADSSIKALAVPNGALTTFRFADGSQHDMDTLEVSRKCVWQDAMLYVTEQTKAGKLTVRAASQIPETYPPDYPELLEYFVSQDDARLLLVRIFGDDVDATELLQADTEAGSGEAEAPTRRTRRDNLKRAIFDAWDKGMPANATASQVFDWLVSKDDTGYICGRDGDELMWENTSGNVSRTSLKRLAARLTSYRTEYEKSR